MVQRYLQRNPIAKAFQTNLLHSSSAVCRPRISQCSSRCRIDGMRPNCHRQSSDIGKGRSIGKHSGAHIRIAKENQYCRTTSNGVSSVWGLYKLNFEINSNKFLLHFSKHFEAEYVLTLQELLEYLEENRLTVFLYISDNSSQMIEKLKASINAVFIERIIVITRSPVTIYQVSLN